MQRTPADRGSDLSMIPFEELALQTTLLYSPPEPAAAEALLAGIAAAEHEAVSGQYLRSLVENCQLHRMDSIVFHKPLPPPTDRWPLGVDLRAALCQLQLEVGGSPHLSHSFRKEAKCAKRVKPPPMREGGPEGDLGEMKEVARMTDVISSVDAGIARRPRAIIEVSSWKRSCGENIAHSLACSCVTLTTTSRLRMTKSGFMRCSSLSPGWRARFCRCCRMRTRWLLRRWISQSVQRVESDGWTIRSWRI